MRTPAISPGHLRGILVVAGWLLTTPARAELTYGQQKVEIEAEANPSVVEAHFRFKNTGQTPVDFNQVQTGCGCTTVAFDKRHYAPGESGDIVAHYTINAAQTGLQKRIMLVTTSDGGMPISLTITVHVPEILRITPVFLTWQHHEAAAAKEIELELAENTCLDEISVRSSNPTVTATLEPVVKGRRNRLIVEPGATEQSLFSTLLVHGQFGATQRDFRTHATVQTPAAQRLGASDREHVASLVPIG